MNDEATKAVAFLSALAGLGGTLLMLSLNTWTWSVRHDAELNNRETSVIKRESASVEHETTMIARDIESQKLAKLKEEVQNADRINEATRHTPQLSTGSAVPNPTPQIVETKPPRPAVNRQPDRAVAQQPKKQKASRASSSLPVLAHSPLPATIRRPDGRLMVLQSRR